MEKNTDLKTTPEAGIHSNDLLSTCLSFLKDMEKEIGHGCDVTLSHRHGDLIIRIMAWPKGKENINYGAELSLRPLDFADSRTEILFQHFKERIKHELSKLK